MTTTTIGQHVGMPWPVIDFHAHFPIAGDDFLAEYRNRYIARHGDQKWIRTVSGAEYLQQEWRRAWSFPEPDPAITDWELLADMWQQEAEQCGLDRVVFMTGGGNEMLSHVITRHPDRLAGFAHHSLSSEHADRELVRAVEELGLVGFKVFAPLVDDPLDSERYEPVWEEAEKRGLTVMIHFGILGGAGGLGNAPNIDPLSLHNTAKAFPGIPFVVPHFGCGYVRELLQLCWACPNVFVDTSGNNEWMRWMPEELNLNILFRRFYETAGPDRMIFGSDSSWFPRGFARRYLWDQLRACWQLRMPEDDMRKIFHDNALKLLRLQTRS